MKRNRIRGSFFVRFSVPDRFLQILSDRTHFRCVGFDRAAVEGEKSVLLLFDVAQLCVDRAAESLKNGGNDLFTVQSQKKPPLTA